MTPRIHSLLLARHNAAANPEDGWIFPSPNNPDEQITDGLTKFQHGKALDDKVLDFVPYVLRHTALTRLGEQGGGDVFVLARIAGRRNRACFCIAILGRHKIGHTQRTARRGTRP